MTAGALRYGYQQVLPVHSPLLSDRAALEGWMRAALHSAALAEGFIPAAGARTTFTLSAEELTRDADGEEGRTRVVLARADCVVVPLPGDVRQPTSHEAPTDYELQHIPTLTGRDQAHVALRAFRAGWHRGLRDTQTALAGDG